MNEEIYDSFNLLFNGLIILAMGITSFVSIIMAMKYIMEIYALTYISNIDSLKYVIKIIGFISLGLITAKGTDIWYKTSPFEINDKLKFNRYRLIAYVIFFVILILAGWSFKIFLRIT